MSIVTNSNKPVTEQQLRESLTMVIRASDPKSKKEITELTRVNEQHMFAALVHGQLANFKHEYGQTFEKEFKEQLPEQIKLNPGHYIFESARLVLRKLRLAGEISKDLFREFRQYAVGMSQLDSKRNELSTKNVTGKAGDTALRALKTAIKKFLGNQPATRQEMHDFRTNNIERRK